MHIPLDGNTILTAEQHMAKPITDPKLWAEMALISPQAVHYGIKPLTHPRSLITTSTGEVVIQYVCEFPLSQFTNVEKTEIRGNTRTNIPLAHDASKKMVAMFRSGNLTTIMARFTEPGIFELHISAYIENGPESLKVPQAILQYGIHNTGRAKPFPVTQYGTEWGETKNFLDAGFSILYPKQAIVKSTNGIAMVQIQLPTSGVLPNMFQLVHCDIYGNSSECHVCVRAEQQGDVAVYLIQCPKVGEYRLEIFVKFERESFDLGAAVLIQCDKPMKNVIEYNSNKQLFGTNKLFHDLGFVTSAKSTTLYVKNGTARLRVKQTRPAEIFATIKKLGNDSNKQYMINTQKDEFITFNISPSEKGQYLLQLFASKPKCKSKEFAGRFLVSNEASLMDAYNIYG